MLLRSILVGFLMGVVYASTYTGSVVGEFFGGPQTYMFGTLYQAVQGEMLTSVAAMMPMHAIVGGVIILAFMVLGILVWPMVERVAMSVSSMVTRLQAIGHTVQESEATN